jgi:TonB family protein
MLRPRMLIGSMVFLLGTTGAAMGSKPASAQEQTSTTTAPTDVPPVKKFGKMDPRHPLHIGDDYYPNESRKHHEQGRCGIAFYINADGSVSAGQLLQSSGYPRLDIACIESVIDVSMLPATVNGTPVAGWSDFGVVWVLDRAPPPQPPLEKSAVPRIADDYEFQVGEKFYPEAARAKHQRGYCVVHTTIGSSGMALNARVTRSTGSEILDKACLAAVTVARFTPELQNGRPVADSTDIAIYW